MSIIIKGMEMPTNCSACPCSRGNECGITRYEPTFEEWYEDGVKDCPLIPVPPHGRCIDADALEDNNITYYAIPVLANVTDAAIREAELVIRLKDLDAAPTIIEAEEGE